MQAWTIFAFFSCREESCGGGSVRRRSAASMTSSRSRSDTVRVAGGRRRVVESASHDDVEVKGTDPKSHRSPKPVAPTDAPCLSALS